MTTPATGDGACLFCDLSNSELLHDFDGTPIRNDHFYVRCDNFPVAKGHVEAVPFRHVDSLFDLGREEWAALYDVMWAAAVVLLDAYGAEGYTIGVNDGAAAGRTVHHLHIHLVPRQIGDVPDPRRGILNIFPTPPGMEP